MAAGFKLEIHGELLARVPEGLREQFILDEMRPLVEEFLRFCRDERVPLTGKLHVEGVLVPELRRDAAS